MVRRRGRSWGFGQVVPIVLGLHRVEMRKLWLRGRCRRVDALNVPRASVGRRGRGLVRLRPEQGRCRRRRRGGRLGSVRKGRGGRPAHQRVVPAAWRRQPIARAPRGVPCRPRQHRRAVAPLAKAQRLHRRELPGRQRGARLGQGGACRCAHAGRGVGAGNGHGEVRRKPGWRAGADSRACRRCRGGFGWPCHRNGGHRRHRGQCRASAC
mmetsp:Transcript_7542/g.21608  ORF Transcript_7542/g.21608 Transcript_7542/m.21608 type:complete len:210 (-) Transcript_7542:279-908(-)